VTSARVVAIAALATLTSGCDPCSGVTNCGAVNAVHVEGRLVDPSTGIGASRAAIAVSVENGETRSLSADDDGAFAFTVGVPGPGTYEYDLAITPLSDSAIIIRGLTCEVMAASGSGCLLGRVVTRPHFWDFVRLELRDAPGEFLVNAEIAFRRTSGARLYGPRVKGDTVRTSTDATGFTTLFGLDAFVAGDVVPAVGDLMVRLPFPLDSTIVRGFQLNPRIVFPQTVPLYLMQVGPSLRATLEFYRGNPSSPAANVAVRFVRTSGIEIGATGLSGVTGADGRVVLRPRPLSRGQVTGDVIVESSSPASTFTITGVTLTTHDDDLAPVILSRDLDAAGSAMLKRPSGRR
jgi:hypothetical protein